MTDYPLPYTSDDLTGRVALVTGASSGLGARFARVLAAKGAKVALCARRIDRVEALAAEITAHYKDCDKLVVVGLLRGSFVFIADLVREIQLPVEVDFLEASSYGDAMHSSREVKILKDLRGEIAGRDVLVVEDIVDTGFTLTHVKRLLLSREPRRLEVCALLDKPSRREVDIKATWTGFEIPDEFVVGYGIDFAQRNRNLPYIGKVRFTEPE